MNSIDYWKKCWKEVIESSVAVDTSSTLSVNKKVVNSGWYEDEHGSISWIDEYTDNAKSLIACQVRYWGEAFVLFKGSRNEKLGKNQNIFDPDSIVATVFVYDPSRRKQVYRGFSMSSCYEEFGAIDDGVYNVIYGKEKTGKLKSNWLINGGEPIDCLDGKNYAYINKHWNTNPYSVSQKDAIYIHSTNRDGSAKVILDKQGNIIGGVSTGCLLIAPSCPSNGYIGWNEFNEQLKGIKSFTLKLIRE